MTSRELSFWGWGFADTYRSSVDHIAQSFEPGVHLIATHPAVDDPELRSIARPDADNYCWAEENRVSDLEVLLDPEVAARIDELEIERVAIEDL